MVDRNTGVRVALLAAGTATTAVFYGLPCGVGGGVWCAPIAGPFIVLARRIRDDNRSSSDEDGIVPPVFVYTLLIELGVVQFMGVAMVATGALLPKRLRPVATAQLSVLPVVSTRSAGLSVVGVF